MQESHTAFAAGQRVIVRDERWAIVHSEQFAATRVIRLRGLDAMNRDEQPSLLAAIETVVALAPGQRLRRRARRAVLSAAATALAESLPWHECWTAGRARVALPSWQLEPARAAVAGAMRILLADAVGLGKTIQAGLIVNELFARSLARRVLILTPPSLRRQWVDELSARFGLSAQIFEQNTLASTVATLPPGVNPWTTAPVIVSSIDLVKRLELRTAVEAAAFDVLIVDEAHHLTTGTDRGDVAAPLAARTPWVVLVTATPHSGDDQAYRFLTALGDVDGAPMRVFLRSRAAGPAARRSRTIAVTPTGDEQALLDGVRLYARRLATQGRRRGARLVGMVIARRAASSASAAARTLMRRLALLEGARPSESQPLLPWEELDAADEGVPDALLARPGFDDIKSELASLRHLTTLAVRAAASSSKVRLLRRLLRRTREQLLVFSEYRDVVLAVSSALQHEGPTLALHGGLSPRERQVAIEAFNTGRVRALVATDTAGEGLNLHARCRLVVTIELPWTPLRLEQRIGRVDRIGQTRRVHALHLVHRGSYEGTVITRLERRRVRMASAHTGAETVVPPVINAAAMAQARDRRDSTPYGSAIYAAPKRRALRPVLMVFTTPLLDGAGRLVHRQVTAVRIDLTGAMRLTRPLLRALTQHPTLRELLRAETAAQAVKAAGRMKIVSSKLARRYAALHAAPDGGHRVWQDSLFDNRAASQARAQAHVLAGVQDRMFRQRAAADALGDVHAGEPQLVAAWLGAR